MEEDKTEKPSDESRRILISHPNRIISSMDNNKPPLVSRPNLQQFIIRQQASMQPGPSTSGQATPPKLPVQSILPKPTTDKTSPSKTVDVVIDSVARGKNVDPLSYRKGRYSTDPSIKSAQIKMERDTSQLTRKPLEAGQPQKPRPQNRHHQPPATATITVSNIMNMAKEKSEPPPPIPHQPPKDSSSKTNLRPVQILAAPRGLLPVPPGTIQQNPSADDHKFKKPMLPIKHRKAIIDEERRRREAIEDAQRVQRHLQEAKRASQEAARAKMEKERQALQIIRSPPKPAFNENQVSFEMKQAAQNDIQKVCFNQEVLEVQTVLLHSKFILKYVCNKHTFAMLSPEHQRHLLKFLPKQAETNLEAVLDTAFTRDTKSARGNPMEMLHNRLKNGYYNAEKINELIQIRDTEKIMYDHYIRMHHMKLFKKLIVSRHILLAQYNAVHVSNIRRPGPQPRAKDVTAEKKHLRSLKRKAAKRSRIMMADCRVRAGEQGISSDDEADDVGEPIHKALQTTIYQRSTLYTYRHKDLDLWQPMKVDDVKTMLKKYQKFKRHNPKAPSLNLKGITLEQVFDRAGVLAQSQKIKETVAELEKKLHRPQDANSRLLFI